MSSEILAVAVDAYDAPGLAAFWAAALGRENTSTWEDEVAVTYVELPGTPMLLFQPVPEPKEGKNRLHLDLTPAPGGTQEGEITRLEGLGARVLDRADRFPWVVLVDPEGNEFCVLPPRDAPRA